MTIKPADLAAVRAVLTGQTSPKAAALNYSSRQKVLLAHAVLVAGGFQQSGPRGEYGELLEEITLRPAALAGPRNEWPKTAWDWYYAQERRLIPASKRLGLHDSESRGGHPVKLVPQPDIVELLDDSELAARGRLLYQRAQANVTARRNHEADQQRRRRAVSQAIKQHPAFGYMFREFSWETDPETLLKLRNVIDELLAKYTPEYVSQ
jgi:hypothetical protein